MACRDERELSSNSADSHALAARITLRHRICFSVRVAVSTYDTALTRIESSVINSRAIALAMTVTLPVFIAGMIWTWLDE